MLRFPPVPLDCAAAYGGALAVVVGGESAGAVLRVCCAAVGEDSLESEARRRCEISTLTVLKVRAVRADDPATVREGSQRDGMVKVAACALVWTADGVAGARCRLKNGCEWRRWSGGNLDDFIALMFICGLDARSRSATVEFVK